MAMQSLIPAGEFKTSYAADTTIFPTAASRNIAILGPRPLLRAAGVRPLHPQPADPDRLSRHRRARAQHPGRLHRADLHRPFRLFRLRRVFLGLCQQCLRRAGVLRRAHSRPDDDRRRADFRPARRPAEGALSRHRHARRAVHPAGFLRPRRMVLRRRGRHGRLAVLAYSATPSTATPAISTWCSPI